MHQQSIFNKAEVAMPNSGKKRAAGPEEEVFDKDEAKKRRYHQHDLRATGAYGGSSRMRLTTGQPAFTASDHRGRQLFPEQPLRGRTRWREGSEPPNWDRRELHARLSIDASYDDGPGAERNPTHDCESGAVASS